MIAMMQLRNNASGTCSSCNQALGTPWQVFLDATGMRATGGCQPSSACAAIPRLLAAVGNRSTLRSMSRQGGAYSLGIKENWKRMRA